MDQSSPKQIPLVGLLSNLVLKSSRMIIFLIWYSHTVLPTNSNPHAEEDAVLGAEIVYREVGFSFI